MLVDAHADRRVRRPVRSARRRTVAWGVAAALVSALFLLPLASMVSGSLRRPGLPPPVGLDLFPRSATADGYRAAFSLVPLLRSVLNSVVVSSAFTVVAVLSASWAGFALARLPDRPRRRVVVFLLLVLMVPVSAVWLARFAMFRTAGLTDTYVPLVAPAIMGGSPLFVLLYLLAFRRIPAEILDAARLEGAGPWHVWRRVSMPLVRGTTVAVGLLAFAVSWANFIDPLLYLSTEERYTAPLVLRSLEQLGPTNWPVLLAGSVVVTAPVVLAFGAALRFIVPRRGAGWLGG